MTQEDKRALAEALANSLKELEGMTLKELSKHQDDLLSVAEDCYKYNLEMHQMLPISECNEVLRRANVLSNKLQNYLSRMKFGDIL